MIEGILFSALGLCGVGWIWFGLAQKPDVVGRNEAVKRMLADNGYKTHENH